MSPDIFWVYSLVVERWSPKPVAVVRVHVDPHNKQIVIAYTPLVKGLYYMHILKSARG